MVKEILGTANDKKKAILRGIRSALLTLGSATKVELSHKLGISFPTISKFLKQMERDGEISVVGIDESSGGRRATRYAYNPECMLGLAIFLEKTEMHYTVFNCLGEVKEQGTTTCLLIDDVRSLSSQIEEIIRKHPQISSLAVGVPGAVNNGRIIHIPGHEQFQNFDLKGYFEERFSIPVVVENDMNAAVLGYFDNMQYKSNPSLVYLYFGQNCPGSGIMINGDVVRGSTFFSGEVTFVPQYDDRNFYQALYHGSGHKDAQLREEEKIDAISRLVVTFTAIINPHTIIFCNGEVNQSMLKKILKQSATYIPQQHLPQLTVSDWKQDYLYGLQSLGLSLVI